MAVLRRRKGERTVVVRWLCRSYRVWVNVVMPNDAPTIMRTKGMPMRAGYFLAVRAKGLGFMGFEENVGISVFICLLSPHGIHVSSLGKGTRWPGWSLWWVCCNLGDFPSLNTTWWLCNLLAEMKRILFVDILFFSKVLLDLSQFMVISEVYRL